MKITTSILVLFVLAGCSHGDSSVVIHPTDENLSVSGQENILRIQTLLRGEDHNPEGVDAVQKLEEMDEISSIGASSGNREEMFGRIEDVVIDSRNRVYILDFNRQDIRVFTTGGEYLATVGRRGDGPGEFRMVRSMAIYNDELLLVGNGLRIEVYDIKNDPIAFAETIQLEKSIGSICVSDDKLFLYGVYPLDQNEFIEGGDYVNMVHAYSLPSFEYLFSFGQSYKSRNLFTIDRMSRGYLSCNEASSTVIFAFEMMPVLQGYSSEDGQLLWKSRIDGLHFPVITETNEGGRPGMAYQMPESNIIDRLVPTVSLDSEFELLQVPRNKAIGMDSGSGRSSEVHSYLLNSTNGEASYIGMEIPELLFIGGDAAASRDLTDGYTVSRIHEVDFLP